MRAVVCDQLGPLSDLRIEERPDLEPGPGQVVVDVTAADLTHVDALFITGAYQIKPPTPFVPGTQAAGVVSAVGEGVDGVAVGDRVITAAGLGAYATQIAIGPQQLLPIPDSMAFVGQTFYVQGVLVDGSLRIGLTDAVSFFVGR